MPTDDSQDHVRRTVDDMTSQEVAATLDQIAALSAAAPPLDLQPARNQPIELPEPPAQVAALTLHIEVEDVAPRVWRRVVVRGDLTLEQFHAVIQRAVGWEDYHLHRFWATAGRQPWRGSYYLTDLDVAEGEEGTHESTVRLDQVFRRVGKRLRYTYDFGDDWHHLVRLESREELADDAPPAVCTDGAMAGPIEDSGGPHGYNDLVEAFSDDPPLSGLEDYVRDWLPERWDPAEFDLDQVNTAISLIGAGLEEVFTTVANGVAPPESLAALLDLAPPDVLAELAQLCRAAAAVDLALDDDDLAAIARPYRFLVDLAGTDGIPLTQAGWMKPAVVQEIFTGLGFDESWIGKGNREDQTLPITQLRQSAQDLGLLRKRKGRLLRTRKAERLRTDRDWVEVIAAGLLRDKDPYLAGARGLFALLSATNGHSKLRLADDVADLMTRCGLRTGPSGVERWHAVEMLRPTWWALDGHAMLRHRPPRADERAVGLAIAALWPDRFAEQGEH